MASRLRTRKKITRHQTPDLSTIPAQPMFQSRPFVVQTQSAQKSQQPDLKTSLRRAQRYGHHLSRLQPAGIAAPAVVKPKMGNQELTNKHAENLSTPQSRGVVQRTQGQSQNGDTEELNRQPQSRGLVSRAEEARFLEKLRNDYKPLIAAHGKRAIPLFIKPPQQQTANPQNNQPPMELGPRIDDGHREQGSVSYEAKLPTVTPERRARALERVKERNQANETASQPIILDESGKPHDAVEPIKEPGFDQLTIGELDRNKTIWENPGGGKQKWKLKKGEAFKLVDSEPPQKIGDYEWVKVKFVNNKTKDLEEGWVKKHATEKRGVPEHVKVHQPIIPPGEMPKPEDVKQGKLGDCYLMAALITVAQQKPQTIINMFTPSPYETQSDRVAVKFYKVKRDSSDYTKKIITPNYVTINKSIVEYVKADNKSEKAEISKTRRFAQGPAIWPAVIEKAYAAWPNRNYAISPEFARKDYQAIEGGHGYQALEHITGEAHEKLELDMNKDVKRGSGKYTQDLLDLFEKIKQALAKQESLTIGTPQDWRGTELDKLPASKGGAGEAVKGGLASKHEYAIVKAEEAGNLKYIHIRNPWGKLGQKYKFNLFGKITGFKEIQGEEGAISKIELSDIPKHFTGIGIKTTDAPD